MLTMMLADAVNGVSEGPLGDFRIDESDRYELETAAWLHDCGKVVTPEYVMDKSTKLETIHDRIDEVESRFATALAELELNFLKTSIGIDDQAEVERLRAEYEHQADKLRDDLAFLKQANVGGEFMADEDISRVAAIASMTWTGPDGLARPLLSDDEVLNLSIRRGTLNDEEREIINNHIVATIKMLESLPFPRNLQNVPEYAGGHHEKMDGTGYPRGLRRDEMSVQARIMAIADIFEALTASDRPYKKGKKLSECLKIMGFMKKDNHIDPDIFDVFIKDKVYLEYAEEFLDPVQIDPIDQALIEQITA